jgi:hypothetical protein
LLERKSKIDCEVKKKRKGKGKGKGVKAYDGRLY